MDDKEFLAFCAQENIHPDSVIGNVLRKGWNVQREKQAQMLEEATPTFFASELAQQRHLSLFNKGEAEKQYERAEALTKKLDTFKEAYLESMSSVWDIVGKLNEKIAKLELELENNAKENP